MQKLLAGRHEPLWARLRQYFRGERYTEKVDMSKAEEVPVALFNAFVNPQAKRAPQRVDLREEYVDLTAAQNQKVDSTSELRLHNGYFSLKLPNGTFVPVNLVKAGDPSLLRPKHSTPIGSIFAQEHDRQLLNWYNESEGNKAKAVEKFLREQHDQFIDDKCPFDEENVKKRLTFLLELLSSISTTRSA